MFVIIGSIELLENEWSWNLWNSFQIASDLIQSIVTIFCLIVLYRWEMPHRTRVGALKRCLKDYLSFKLFNEWQNWGYPKLLPLIYVRGDRTLAQLFAKQARCPGRCRTRCYLGGLSRLMAASTSKILAAVLHGFTYSAIKVSSFQFINLFLSGTKPSMIKDYFILK